MSASLYTLQVWHSGQWHNYSGFSTENRDEALEECIALLESCADWRAARALLGENGSGNGAVAHYVGQLPATSEDALRRIENRLRNEFLTAAALALDDVMSLLDAVCQRAPVVHAANFGDRSTYCGITLKPHLRRSARPGEVTCRRCFAAMG